MRLLSNVLVPPQSLSLSIDFIIRPRPAVLSRPPRAIASFVAISPAFREPSTLSVCRISTSSPGRATPTALPTLQRRRCASPCTFSRLPPSQSTVRDEEDQKHQIEPQDYDQQNKSSKMSDQDYASFLEKASGDQQASTSGSSKKTEEHFTSRTVDDDAQVPKPLRDAASSKDAVYESDADEQFVPVSLPLKDENAQLDAKAFAHATGLKEKDVEELSVKQFDAHGRYKKLIGIVESEGGAAKVFRVQLKGARAEYWVVAVKDGKRLIGVKAGAVES